MGWDREPIRSASTITTKAVCSAKGIRLVSLTSFGPQGALSLSWTLVISRIEYKNILRRLVKCKKRYNDCLVFSRRLLRSMNVNRWAEAPNTPPRCGGASRPWRRWAQTISMASCLIGTLGNSENMDSIHQAKVWSYPWNKQTNVLQGNAIDYHT